MATTLPSNVVESAPLTHFERVMLTCSISMGTLLVAIDTFITNVAVPTISGDLGVSSDIGSWTITAFTVASAIVGPLTGFLALVLGRVRFFCVSALLFAFFSWCCGISFTMPMLLGFRFLQGLSSGCLIPLSQALLMYIYPPSQRSFAIGLWGLVAMAGPAIAPTLGGWITDNYGWGWIFYINIPIGIYSGLVTYFFLIKHDAKPKKVPIDILGLTLFACGIAALQIMLDRGNDLDWFKSGTIIALTIISFVLLVYFVIWNYYHSHPIIDFNLFKDRNFTLGCIIASFGTALLFGSLVIEPLWVQGPLGYTPLLSGLTLAPFGIGAFIFFPLLGYFMPKLNTKFCLAIGITLFGLSYFWFSKLYMQVPFWAIAAPRFIQGTAFAFFLLPLTSLALSRVPAEKLASASGVFAFVRMLCVGIGVSLAVSYWLRRAQFYQSRFTEFTIPSNPFFGDYLNSLRDMGIVGEKAQGVIYKVVTDQALTMSLLDYFYIGFLIFLTLFAVFFVIRYKKQKTT